MRPVASDFFQDEPDTSTKTLTGPWRRNIPPETDLDFSQLSLPIEETANAPQSPEISYTTAVINSVNVASVEAQPASPLSGQSTSLPNEHNGHISRHTSNLGQQRTSRPTTVHKEAGLSALDDAMSRIKGALDGMQANDPQRGSAETETQMRSTRSSIPQSPPFVKSVPLKEPRWIPPALRVRHQDFDIHTREAFLVTGSEPPHSPNPAFVVRLPAVSRALELLHKRQLNLAKIQFPVRWDIFSWDPPIEGMNRRDFSLNDLLFRKPVMFKGKFKYRVSLPRSKLKTPSATGVAGPRVNLPANPTTSKFNGRLSEADGMATWRKPTSPAPTMPETADVPATNSTLDTISRSPPPELPIHSDGTASLPKPDVSLSGKGEVILVRTRSQPKMPAGSVVAFYRDSRIDTVDAESDTLVSFIVNSELEDPPPLSQPGPSKKPIITLSPPSVGALPEPTESVKGLDSNSIELVNNMVNGLKSQRASPECEMPLLVQSKLDGKSSDGSVSCKVFPDSIELSDGGCWDLIDRPCPSHPTNSSYEHRMGKIDFGL
jgi:serine/arginine repetitive matrix protein 2